MRRRICFAVTAVAAGSLAVGVGMATAASSTTTTGKPTVVKCSMSLTTEPPAGSSSVNPPESKGSDYGPIHCPTKGFGGGVESVAFTVPDTGDTVGKYTEYFSSGTVKGSFDLTPGEGNGFSFTSESWTGTLEVISGTGIYKGIKQLKPGKKGLGTMTCTSADSVHLSCKAKIKVAMP